MDNKNFMQNTEENFLNCLTNKKLILFGAGKEMEKAIDQIITPNGLKVSYSVDNDFRKWYSKYCGIEIREPECLKDENVNDVVVLITSVYPYRIEKQLQRYGIHYYYSSLLFLEEHIGQQQFMVMF